MAGEGEEEILREKALFCVRTGIAPSEYDRMTAREVAIFTEVWNEENSG